MDKIAVIILHYKNEDDTVACLHSLSKPSRYFTIVVANNSSRQFASELKIQYPEIEVIVAGENVGFAEGNNIGLKKAMEKGCEYMVILNNDVVVDQNLVEKMVKYAQKNPSIGLISPKIYFYKGFEYHANRYKNAEKGRVIWYAGGTLDWANIYATHRGVDEVDRGQYEETVDTDFATGCCMLIKRKTIETIGLLDRNYFLYFEDADYSVRAKKSNFRVVHYPETHLWHKNASSSGKPGSITHIYYQTRNRLYFGFKYASLRAKKSLLLESIKFLLKGSVWKKAVLDYFLGKMGKGNI